MRYIRTFYLSPKLYNKLYGAMQYENALALRTSLETGWRIDDVLHLQPKNIRGRTATITAMKTGKADKKVLSADLVKRLLQIANKEWVFVGRFGDKPRTRQAVWKDVKKASKFIGLQGNISCHSARKTYGVEAFKDGGLAEAQQKLQHSDISTTMIYAFADCLDDKYRAENKPETGGDIVSRFGLESKSKQTNNKPRGVGEATTEIVGKRQEEREFAVLVADIVVGKMKDYFDSLSDNSCNK